MFNWLCTFLLGAMVSFFMNTFRHFANVFLIAFVIIMVTGATIQLILELTPPFFRYGYGLPLYNAMNGARHLLFGSHSRFALNVGVLIIFAAFFSIWVCSRQTIWVLIREIRASRKQEKKNMNRNKTQTTQTTVQKH